MIKEKINNTAWTNKGTRKDAVLAEKEVRAAGLYTFRVRVTYETKQNNNLSLFFALEKHRLLNNITEFMKTLHDESRVTAWTSIGGKDFVSPYTAEKYVSLLTRPRTR